MSSVPILLCVELPTLPVVFTHDRSSPPQLSDTDGEADLPENPMSPEQIALMLDRQIALTRELDIDPIEDSPTTTVKRAPPPPISAPTDEG